MAWTPLHAAVHQTLRQRQLLQKGQSIVLAFSAGQDSMCLLQILRDLQPKWQWQLAIAHCNHRWPPDSNANADHVAQLARDWGLRYDSFTAPTILKGEAEGREWRYEMLRKLSEDEGFSAVLTAHTASDRAETLLFNLFRGSGMDGLQALAWQRPLSQTVNLIRPLLNITRPQTAAFCEQFQLPIWQDSMNKDLAYRRNQIRLELLPSLRQQFNPKVDLNLARTAEILQAETEYLDCEATRLLQRATIPDRELANPADSWRAVIIAALDQPTLQTHPLALQRRAIRQWLQHHLNIQPNFTQIEKTVALVRGHHGDRTDPLIATVVVEVKRSWICLYPLSSGVL